MRAITLHRPWAHCVAHLVKRVENRGWRLPRTLEGQRVAIHAGKCIDWDALADVSADEVALGHPPLTDPGPCGIVATAVLACDVFMVGEVTAEEWAALERQHGNDLRRWWTGPHGWILTDVRTLTSPVPCNGAQGFWTVPDDIEAAVLAAGG